MTASVGRAPDFLSSYAEPVEAEMRAILTSPDPMLEPLFQILRYHMGWTDRRGSSQRGRGKRVRPVLCLLACEAAGGNPQVAVPAAASVELLHNFSLVHDDIEDKSPARRGRETVWSLWGVPLAINAGDAILILAHQAIHGLRERGLPASSVQEASAVLQSAGRALFEGQYLDLVWEDAPAPTVSEYLVMAERKTAALLGAACHIGAIAAGAEDGPSGLLREFGRDLGLAFQVTDDILGIWGDSAQTGKPVGEDLLRGKKSLPVAFGLEEERRRGEGALAKLLDRPPAQEDLAAAVSLLAELGAPEHATRLAESYLESALGHLSGSGLEREAVSRLEELANYIVHRQA